MESPMLSSANLRTAFVLLLVVAVTALFLAVTWPFLEPLLLGALLAGLFHPLYRWITRLLGGRQSLGAVVTLLVVVRSRPCSSHRISGNRCATGPDRK
jgi:predicted PurR-regulated permease PerM